MPFRKTYKKRPTFRRRRRRNFRSKYKKKNKSQFNYGKINTIGLPLNLYTYIRFSSIARTFNLPTNPLLAPFVTGTTNNYILGLNMITPWNMDRNLNAPVADLSFFGSDPSPSTFLASPPAPNQTTWSQITWWARWFHKMRITHVTYTLQIRLVNDAPTGNSANPVSNNNPLIVTVLEGKYIPGILTPEILALQGSDDLQSTKGSRSYVCSGGRDKPLVIKRKVSIKKLLGCTNLNDVQESECVINNTMSTIDLTNRQVRNPAVTNECFSYIRIRRPATEEGSVAPMRYTIQCSAVAKVQFFQQRVNNPLSVTGNTSDPQDPGEPPVETGSSS